MLIQINKFENWLLSFVNLYHRKNILTILNLGERQYFLHYEIKKIHGDVKNWALLYLHE